MLGRVVHVNSKQVKHSVPQDLPRTQWANNNAQGQHEHVVPPTASIVLDHSHM